MNGMTNKYENQIRQEHPDLPSNAHTHMFRRTRATNLYQSDEDLELVLRIIGHESTQTTRIYATPSLEMLKAAYPHIWISCGTRNQTIRYRQEKLSICQYCKRRNSK